MKPNQTGHLTHVCAMEVNQWLKRRYHETPVSGPEAKSQVFRYLRTGTECTSNSKRQLICPFHI